MLKALWKAVVAEGQLHHREMGGVTCPWRRLRAVGVDGERMRGKGVYRRGGEVRRDERRALEGEVEERGREMRRGKEGNISDQPFFQIAITMPSSGTSSLTLTLLQLATLSPFAQHLGIWAPGCHTHLLPTSLTVPSSHCPTVTLDQLPARSPF